LRVTDRLFEDLTKLFAISRKVLLQVDGSDQRGLNYLKLDA
jgi:hypothetical protein